ncbi:PAS domain-containing sensor histidine kinase [Patiriisocius marinus]|uniref:PAS domain-containing sensor histidine kinase n=1 Tax=Patiriisocius marinus TaxID=1397112 RepID=UPI00232F1525|nr:PAS domain-containing sensor histidine kinase [Patiriisocius marinus]
MIIEPTIEELIKQNSDLKKQIKLLTLDVVENTENLKQAELNNEIASIQINQLKSTLDHLDTCIYIKDRNRKYLYANKKTLKLFGCTDQDLQGSVDSNFFPKETCEKLAEIDHRILELGENTSFEVESKDPEGNRLVFLENKTPIFDKTDTSKIIGLCGISTDITKRKNIQEKIVESEQELKQLNATKDKLFSIIAHDLRSPFYGILGFSELLKDNLSFTEDTESKEYISIINTSAQNTLTLLDNLLNWAKTQTNELSIRLEKIILSEMIQEVITLKKTLSKSKKIKLNYFPETGIEIELFTDKTILQSILRNLISNAIKFTNIGGTIDVKVISNQDHVEVSISDNGLGMNKETINQLFKLSNSSALPGTADEQGSGLGLILCKEFVEKLGGRIWAESTLGKGSDFKFIFPIKTVV